MKRILTLVLSLLLLLNLILLPCSAEEEAPVMEEIIEEYTNTQSAFATLSINSSGSVTIRIDCIGKSGTTHISSRTYLEKWTGSSWCRVCINGASEICDGVSGSSLSKTYTTTVGSGTYRVTAIFTVTKGTDETITVYSNIVTH